MNNPVVSTVDLGVIMDGGLCVAIGVLLGSQHKPLRVHGVIVDPVGHWSHRDSANEHARAGFQNLGGQVTTV